MNAGPFLEQRLTRSDETGAFETRAVPDGVSLRLMVQHPAFATDCVEVVPSRSDAREVNFVVQPAGALEVHALLDGEPILRCYIQTEGDCPLQRYLPRESGELVAQGLPAGELEFTAIIYPENGAFQQQTVTATVVAGQTTPVEVRFESGQDQEDHGET